MDNMIKISDSEFEEFYAAVAKIIQDISSVCEVSHAIVIATMEIEDGGKNFYISETKEKYLMFYSQLYDNLIKLNSFYCKLFEFLQYIAKQMKKTDEYLANILNERLTN